MNLTNRYRAMIRHALARRFSSSHSKSRLFTWFTLAKFCAVEGALHAALCFAVVHAAEAEHQDVLAECAIEGGGKPLILCVAIAQTRASGDSKAAGVPLKMMLDTGASASAFDDEYAGLLGQAKGVRACRSAAGTLVYRAFSAPMMYVGNCSLRPKGDVVCFDFDQIRGTLKREIDGLVGMDVLAELVISIDFDERKLRFHRTVPADPGKAVALRLNETVARNCVFVLGSINGGAELDFLVDTGSIGAYTGSLDDDAFDNFVKAGTLRRTDLPGQVVGAVRAAKAVGARSHEFVLAGYRHRGLVFHRLNFPNSLGLDYLSRYKVIFDFPNRTMYLRPGRTFEHVDIWDRLGLSLRKTDGKVEVKTVVPGGPAAKSGVEAGDRLLMIDEVSTESLTTRDARRMLSTDGQHALELWRRDARVCVTIRADDQ